MEYCATNFRVLHLTNIITHIKVSISHNDFTVAYFTAYVLMMSMCLSVSGLSVNI